MPVVIMANLSTVAISWRVHHWPGIFLCTIGLFLHGLVFDGDMLCKAPFQNPQCCSFPSSMVNPGWSKQDRWVAHRQVQWPPNSIECFTRLPNSLKHTSAKSTETHFCNSYCMVSKFSRSSIFKQYFVSSSKIIYIKKGSVIRYLAMSNRSCLSIAKLCL